MKRIIVFILLTSPTLFAQNKNESKFQQNLRYTIEAELDTTAKQLTGYMTIFYKNNAPDSITSFFLQVPANAYSDAQNTAVREMQRFNRGNITFSEGSGHKLTIQSLQFLSIGSHTSFPIQAFDFSDTILDLPLPVALAPGDTMSIGVSFVRDYKKRFKSKANTDSSTVHFNFVDWFPRVAVYNQNGWQVEPFHFMMESADVFNEFAQMVVTVKVPGHYIVAGSGEVVEGDPGWLSVKTNTSLADSVVIAWHDSLKKKLFEKARQTGPRQVRFAVKKAQNFILSASPNFIYYEKQNDFPIHILAKGSKYRHWEKEIFTRIDSVLLHVAEYFGPYPFDHLTLVEARNDGSAQPMLLMFGETGFFSLSYSFSKMYVPGIVAINGVQESWISKGLAVYMGKRAAEWRYGERGYPMGKAQEDMNWLQKRYPLPTLDQALRSFSLLYMESGQNEAISKKINDYSDPISTAFNLYMKSEIFYEMLEYVVGKENMKKILRQMARTYQFKYMDESDLRQISEKVYGQDLDWFFEQWLRGTPTVDYAKGKVKQYRKGDSTWVTEVEIKRKGDGIMPVEVEIDTGNGEKVVQRWDGKESSGKVVFETPAKPRGIKVDPKNQILDADMLNNGRRRFEFHPDLPMLKLFHIPSDAYLVLWRPLLGYNHIDGLRLGLGIRGSYRAFYRNLSLELAVGLKSQVIDGKIAYNHPLHRGSLLNRYNLMVRRIEGRYELDWHLVFNGSDGILTSNSRSLRIGLNESGVSDRAYTLRKVAGDTGKVAFNEWDDKDILLVYGEGRWRMGGEKLDFKTRLRVESALPGGDAQFTKFAGRAQMQYKLRGLTMKLRGNAGTSFGPDRLPAQDQFRAEGASPRERFSNDILRTGRDYTTFTRRFTEGGGNLRGYVGQPLPVEKYATVNLELGPSRPFLALRWFGFYDAGRLWPEGENGATNRANAGIGAAFLGGLSQLFGGNLPLFESLSARIYFPFWLSDPLPGEKQTRFRWYFSIGKQL